MRRREFIALLGGAAAWPLAARAQQGERVRRVGALLVGAGNDPAWQVYAAALRRGLIETGFVEGRNLAVEYRWADGQYDRLPSLAADLVRQQVTVIVAGANPSAVAAKAATTTIPIVFWVNRDPVALGLVASLNHPGGNLTGVVTLSGELGPKRLELMRELVPAATTIAVLVNPINPGSETQSRDAQAAARTLGLQLHVLHASTEHDLEAAFETLIQLRAGGLVISSDAFFVGRSEKLAALALRHVVPAIFQYREFAAAGGLMSYGGNITEAIRLAGIYTGRILKDEKPADLPVQQATKVELFLNLRTARTLGLTVPSSLLGRADEVIE
jgi:putative tryptophan/tyrosine transport system substrate-binding protein